MRRGDHEIAPVHVAHATEDQGAGRYAGLEVEIDRFRGLDRGGRARSARGQQKRGLGCRQLVLDRRVVGQRHAQGDLGPLVGGAHQIAIAGIGAGGARVAGDERDHGIGVEFLYPHAAMHAEPAAELVAADAGEAVAVQIRGRAGGEVTGAHRVGHVRAERLFIDEGRREAVIGVELERHAGIAVAVGHITGHGAGCDEHAGARHAWIDRGE